MYVNYHCHRDDSNLMLPDSVATMEDYAKRAVELGHTVLSSCAHGTQGNYWLCASAAEKYGLKWRYVSEAYFVLDREEKDNTNCHIILAAKTAKGVGDLNFALSEANISGYYYRPRVDMELLLTLDPKDVFVTTACIAGIWKYGPKEAEKIIRRLHSHFRDSFMLEVQNHHTQKQRELNEHILSLYRKHGIPLIAGMDSHFILPEDSVLRDARLEANHIIYEDEDGWFLDYPSDEEAIRRFREQGVLSEAQIMEAMDNTHVFLSFEDVTLDRSKKIPTIYPDLTQEERNRKYSELVYSEWERYSEGLSEEEKAARLEGIAYEVETVTSTNMSDYFILNHALVKKAVEKGGIITTTGRGSAVSYITNMLLGFSSVDRYAIPVEMFPDRFISADRLKAGNLPDIDLNLANEEVFAAAQAEILGAWHSAPMVAFGTLRRLSAWKMYCRASNVPYDTAKEVGDMLRKYETDLRYAEDDSELDISQYIPEEYHELLDMSEKYLGVIDSFSPHPCAFLLCQGDIRREIGIIRLKGKSDKKPVYAALIDGVTAEAYGYLKNDLLHVDVVKINREVFSRVGIPQPDVQKLLELTHGDKETWRMYASGLTMGLNQVERDKTREKVMQYKPKNITELSAFVAAVRPGFKSMLPLFLNRQRFEYGIAAFDKLIQTREMNSSWVLYQEQTMKTLQYAGFTSPESYAAIKAIAKKHPEKVLPLKERFLAGFGQKIREDDTSCGEAQAIEMSAKVWQIIEDTTSYSFNASHAVCVALDSLYGAYAKAHYPLEYYTTLLQNYAQKGDKDRIALVKEEMAKGFGIRVVPCKFRQDNRGFYLDREANTIADALTSVKYVSQRVADSLYEMRDNQYPTFIDLLHEMDLRPAFDLTNTEVLIRMGYFHEFGSVGKLLGVLQAFRNGPYKFSKNHVEATQRKRLELLRRQEAEVPEQEISIAEQVKFEADHYGTVLSTFPECKGHFAVLDVDAKYSPKLRLYNLASGTVGIMKIRKDLYSSKPLESGHVIHLKGWDRRPAYQFIGGKSKPKQGVTELWIREYTVL